MITEIGNVTTLFLDEVSEQETLCREWSISTKLTSAKTIASIVTLGIINVLVIIGNMLVILAVFASAKLRTVTNFLIVSLAVADLLVGIIVLPYSISLEVLDGVWIFGNIWCQIWLAVDVWMCTASILNLVAISIDRYLAITRPVHYRSIMTGGRVKLLIAGVWVLSFIICFPPLVGWNDDSVPNPTPAAKADSNISEILDATEEMLLDLTQLADFLNETVHQDINNTTGWTIADVANHTSTVMPTTEASKFNSSSLCAIMECALIGNKGYVIYSALGSFYIPMLIMLFFYFRIYRAALRTTRALQRGFKTSKQDPENKFTLRIHRGNPSADFTLTSHDGDIIVPRRTVSASVPTIPAIKRVKNRRSLQDMNGGYFPPMRTKEMSVYSAPPGMCQTDPCGMPFAANGKSRAFFTRVSKRNARWHARRFHSEAKATKTVGIIVGGFIFCWLPFFTVYLIRAFCEDCISDILFTVVFWLGYCNSAANPLIYGMFSKDFRSAFKKIICRCKLKEDGVTSLIKQIHMPTFFEDMPDDNSQ